MIRMVAIDMDGTLLSDDWTVLDSAQDAIRRAAAKGVIITLATGRMFSSAVQFAHRLRLEVPLITYNGALIRESVSEKTYAHWPVSYDLAHEVLAVIQEYGVHANLYFNDRLFVKEINREAIDYMKQSSVEATPVGDLGIFLSGDAQRIAGKGLKVDTSEQRICGLFENQADESCEGREKVGPTKILGIAEPRILVPLRQRLMSEFGDVLNITGSESHYLEIMAAGVSKARALQVVSRIFDIRREEIMALGDSHNDMEMIDYAGVGVAVANARLEVKEIADYVAQAKHGDGVAEAIDRFILNS